MKKESNLALQLDTLNIFLMLLSLILAFNFPFELFLLAYAILGPLHYLTEINWLEQKSFFVKSRKWVWFLVLATALIALPFVIVSFGFKDGFFAEDGWVRGLRDYAISLTFSALITAVVLTLTKNWKVLLVTVILSFAIGQLMINYYPYLMLVGVLLPSVFHVFLFTFFFMLYGALKGKSSVGVFGAILLLGLPVVIYLMPIDLFSYHSIHQYFVESYDASRFSNLNYGVGWLIGGIKNGEYYPLMSEIGVKIQIFIAFAYTYHYLNWFSKTTVIGWHKVISKPRLALIIVGWAFSLLLYYYNYYVGFLLLLFLSYLHVLLEFPLNATSIKEIFKSLFQRSK